MIDGRYKVRLLDIMAPGRSLAASRPVLSLDWTGMATSRRISHGRAVNNTDTFGALLTPDGGRSRPCCGRTLAAARCSCWPTGQA